MTRAGLALVAAGIILVVVSLIIGFPKKVPDDGVYVIRGVGASDGAKISGPISPADGNLWFGAAVPTILIGAGLVVAGRRRPSR